MTYPYIKESFYSNMQQKGTVLIKSFRCLKSTKADFFAKSFELNYFKLAKEQVAVRHFHPLLY